MMGVSLSYVFVLSRLMLRAFRSRYRQGFSHFFLFWLSRLVFQFLALASFPAQTAATAAGLVTIARDSG